VGNTKPKAQDFHEPVMETKAVKPKQALNITNTSDKLERRYEINIF
jgi:hypothetical protein